MIRSILILVLSSLAQAQDHREVLEKAISDFHQGRIQDAVAEFDKVAKLAPGHAPQLWQRGIALYYAGRFKDCRAQFELHRTVNPNDVENAAWHFLCVARAESPAKAKDALLPVGPDPRVPMGQIYRMFRGEVSPAQVVSAAGSDSEAQFYAHLYIGLYYEASGRHALAMEHIRIASDARYAFGGYMHGVARVHVRLR